MPRVKLIHNANAGDESHSEQRLISMMESKGFICDYSPAKSDDLDIPPGTDFLVVAGGDGTIKKAAKKLLERKLMDKRFPIAILPLGTANNLSRSLKIAEKTEQNIDSWLKPKIKKFDVGRVYGLNKFNFFLEGLGYGVFPYLIHQMKRADKNLSDDPDKRIEAALKTLRKIISSYKKQHAHIIIDGQDHSGDYLMVEIMNIPSIGPNLLLAPGANISDGLFDVVMVKEEQRAVLGQYVEGKLSGNEIPLDLPIISGKEIYIKWTGVDGHVDDKLIRKREHPELKIDNHRGLLEFLH